MSKLKVFVLIFVLPLSSLAQPGLGDWVIYDQEVKIGDSVQRAELTKKIVEVDAGPQYFISQRGSNGQDHDYWLSSGQLIYVKDTREFCEEHPSPAGLKNIEEIETPQGLLLTCHIRRRDNAYHIWYAAEVPFGYYKELTNFSASTYLMHTAKDFGWGGR